MGYGDGRKLGFGLRMLAGSAVVAGVVLGWAGWEWFCGCGPARAEEVSQQGSSAPEVSNPPSPIRPGSQVVVCRPTQLKVEAQVLARLLAGTELQVEQVQGDWLWVAYRQKRETDRAPGQQEAQKVIHGWVRREDVIPGPGGRFWWLRMLPPDLQELLGRRARESLKDQQFDWLRDEAGSEVLVSLASRRGIPGLRETVRDEHSWVRRAAAEALGKLGDRESIPALREALKDPDGNVRCAAAEALGNLGDRESAAALREALKDKDSDVRRAAAKALGNLGDRESIPALREALKHYHHWDVGNVPRAAAEALLGLGEFPQTKRELVYFLVGRERLLRQEAKEVFLEDLNGGPGEATYAAAKLIQLGEPDTVSALIDFLRRRGDVEVAQRYLNCGQPELEKAAREWATARGYSIMSLPGMYDGPRWGR